MQTASAKRKNDAVITVRQNNKNHAIEIADINMAAEKLTGSPLSELISKPLTMILPPKVKDMVESYIDYEAGGNDLASVLRRVRNFEILNREGKSIPVSLKVFYVLSEDLNPQYELLIRDTTLIEKIEELKEKLIEQKKVNTEFDEEVDLARSQVLYATIKTISEFMEEFLIDAIFSVIYIDDFAKIVKKHGKEKQNLIIKQLGKIVKKASREEDVVAHMGNGYLGVILFDCAEEHAESVIGRIADMISNANIILDDEGKEQINITTSFTYHSIKPHINVKQLVEDSAHKMQEIQGKGKRQIQKA